MAMDKAQAIAFIEDYLNAHNDEMIETLTELIRIRSVKEAPLPSMPFGKGIHDVLDASLAHAKRLGFEPTNLDHYIGWADCGEGDQTFGIMVHLDVVPEGTGWRVDPYAAAIEGRRMLGRGTIDNKGPAVASLYALAAVKESGIALNQRVRLLFGCDEESGEWADFDYYKKHEKLPETGFSPDGDYPLVNSEKGILHVDIAAKFPPSAPSAFVRSITGGTRPNVVPPEASAIVTGIAIETIDAAVRAFESAGNVTIHTEKSGDDVFITLKGKGAHASTPEKGVNALTALIALLLKLPIDKTLASDALHKLAVLIPFGEYDGTSAGVACKDDKSGALTLNLGVMEMTTETLQATIDIRHPVTCDHEPIMTKLQEKFSPYQVTIRNYQASHYVEESSPLVQALLKVYTEKTGKEAYCISIGGGTYARTIEGAVTFGCEFPGMEALPHQPDEFIDLDELLLDAKIIAAAIVEICA